MLNDIVILEATSQYSKVIPYLFPEARDLKTSPTIYIAFHRSNSKMTFTGAAILASPLGFEDPSYKFSIQVLNPWKGFGIGNSLLDHVINEARILHAPAIRNLQPVSGCVPNSMLINRRFSLLRNTITHKFELKKLFLNLEETMGNLKNKGRMPTNVKSSPYLEDKEHEISKLCMKEFGSLTHGHLKSLGQYPSEGVDYSFSRSFLYGKEFVGSLGVGVIENVAVFDPLLIANGRRNSWAFTLIIHTILEELINNGIENGVAQVHEDNKKIMALMKRVDAESSDVESLHELIFGLDESS